MSTPDDVADGIEQLDIRVPDGAEGDGSDDDDDDDDDGMVELPEVVMNRLMVLKGLHEERAKLRESYKEERIALEKKYRGECSKLDEKRADVVTGQVDVQVEGETPAAPEDGEEPIVGVPQFWLGAIGHHEVAADLIEEEDIPALEFLKDVKLVEKEDCTGFSLQFHFKPNPFFSNSVLTKSYDIPNMLEDEEPVLDGVTGTAIQWKEGQNLCEREVQKKQRQKKGRKAGQVRVVTSMEKRDSFFNFFTAPEMPNRDKEDDDEEDDEEEEEYMQKFDADYSVATAFRTQIIPNALLWYTGEAADDDDDDEDFVPGDSDGEDDDDDDDDDEEEDDEAEEEDAGGGFSFKPPETKPFPGGAPGEEQPECKQS